MTPSQTVELRPKIPYGGFSPVRLQVTAPLAACPCALALYGDRRSPALCRAAGSAPPHLHRRVKCVRTSPVAVTVCRELRVRLRQTRFPGLCVPAGALHLTVDHPRALSSAAVVVSAASSVLRPDPPDSCPRTDFAFSLIRSALPFADAPGGARALPSFASCALSPCRCPYAAGVTGCVCPSLPR